MAQTEPDSPCRPADLVMTPEMIAAERGVPLETVQDWINTDRLMAIREASGRVWVPRPVVAQFMGDVTPPPVPPELLQPQRLEDWLAAYERAFGMTTEQMLADHAAGRAPDLRDGEEEREYEHWLRSARRALAEGLISAPSAAQAR